MPDRTRLANLLTAVLLAIAAALPVWQATFDYGWLEMAMGRFAVLFWAIVLIWATCVVLVLRWQRRWWVLLTAPVVLYPVVLSGGILTACANGNCL